MKKFLIVVFLLASSPIVASCQTAEEAVMFITQGYYQDGATMPVQGVGEVSVKRTGPSSWDLLYMNRGAVVASMRPFNRTTIKTQQPCRFEVTAGGSIMLFDFENVSGVELGETTIEREAWTTIKIVGVNVFKLKQLDQNGAVISDTSNNEYNQEFKVSKDRLLAAIGYFREKYCKGKAF